MLGLGDALVEAWFVKQQHVILVMKLAACEEGTAVILPTPWVPEALQGWQRVVLMQAGSVWGVCSMGCSYA